MELIGVVDEEDNDMTTVDATISNSTEVVIQTVAGNTGAIGYISLGSLDDTVKGVNIDAWSPLPRTLKTAPTPCPVPSMWPPRRADQRGCPGLHELHHERRGQAIVAEDYIPVSGVEPLRATAPPALSPCLVPPLSLP